MLFSPYTVHRIPYTFFYPVNPVKERQLLILVDDWVEIYKDEDMPVPPPTAGKKYSGKFHLRLGSELHQAIAVRVMQTVYGIRKNPLLCAIQIHLALVPNRLAQSIRCLSAALLLYWLSIRILDKTNVLNFRTFQLTLNTCRHSIKQCISLHENL